MLTLDAQSLLFDLAGAAAVHLPDQWMHLADNRLAFRVGDGPTHCWRAVAVAEMAARWQARGDPVPTRLASLAERHRKLTELLGDGDLPPPDRIVHDLDADEVVAMWDEPKLMVILEADGTLR